MKNLNEIRLATHRNNILVYVASFLKEDKECKDDPFLLSKELTYFEENLDLLIASARECGRRGTCL